MKTFALDRNYAQVDFEQISVDELEVISGGSGGFSQCVQSIATGAAIGAVGGAAGGSVAGGIGSVPGAIGGAIFGAAFGAIGCFG